MKTRKQLLAEADGELKQIKSTIKEVDTRGIQRLKDLTREYRITLNAAITELKENQKDMENLINRVQGSGMSDKEINTALNSFWMYKKTSPVNKLMKIMQTFGDKIQNHAK